jgi:hypothetical protein
MLTVEKVDLRSKAQIDRFVRIPFRLYANHPQWVPPFISDIQVMLNKQKHPFYEHSDADFFIAVRDGRDVGRIAALENRHFNEQHKTKDAEFYLFESEDDQEAANYLFNKAFEWARQRGLNHMVGPKGFSPFDGYGILVEGFEHLQMMVMMNYNYPYYARLVETVGFTKEVDFVSCYLAREYFKLDERMHKAAEKVEKKGTFQVLRFRSKRELTNYANRIGQAYNKTFINNWEYYPLTDHEIDFTLKGLLTVADPKLIKIITHQDEVVGFLLAFPDISAALQRGKGKINLFTIIDMLLEFKRTKWVSMNGAGVLPEYHGVGGNILLYSEMEKTITDYQFIHAELTQVAETAVQMRNDLINVGGKAYKNHRVYKMDI